VRPTAIRLTFRLLLATSASLLGTTAQAAALGAFLGPDRCGIGGDFGQNTEIASQTGLLAGAQGEIGLARGIALSLQPMYVRQETKATTVSDSANTDLKLTLDSFSVPVVVKFGLGGGRTYVSSGLDIRFLSKAKVSTGDSEQDAKSLFNDVNLGALIGFGVLFPVGRPRITTELRYVAGLTNMAKATVGDLPERFHSYGWQLTAGILLPLGGR
jgi:outer membrane protein with beta-barrel domain